MAKIQVILLEDVAGQGRKGEIVTVSDGYARNFLFNNKKGVLATPEELQKIENRKKKEAKKQEEERNKSLELKNSLTILVNSWLYSGVSICSFANLNFLS